MSKRRAHNHTRLQLCTLHQSFSGDCSVQYYQPESATTAAVCHANYCVLLCCLLPVAQPFQQLSKRGSYVPGCVHKVSAVGCTADGNTVLLMYCLLSNSFSACSGPERCQSSRQRWTRRGRPSAHSHQSCAPSCGPAGGETTV